MLCNIKKVTLIVLALTIQFGCSKPDEEPSDDCDSKILALSNILLEKNDAFSQNQTDYNCEAVKTAWFNNYDQLKACGRNTPELDAERENLLTVDCNVFNGGGGGSSTNGNAVFFVNQSIGSDYITVNCNGQTRTISVNNGGTTANCGSSGNANFTFPAGTYSYTASNSVSTWSGDITIANGGCSALRLILPGGGGTGDNIGHLTVWTSGNYDAITVTCGGQTRYITSYYSSEPNCEAGGCAVFDLPFGQYTINASNSSFQWNPFTMNINQTGQCFMLHLL